MNNLFWEAMLTVSRIGWAVVTADINPNSSILGLNWLY